MKDSFYRDEQVQATAKFSEELNTADKEKEIIQLNVDKKIASATANRNKIIFFLILLGLLSSIYFIVRRIKQKNLIEQEARDKNFRSKLSSDLHDDVGTILTSLSMQSELLEMKASEDNKGTVGKIADMSRDATRRMRDTVWAIDSRKDNVMDLAYRMIDFAEDILEPKNVEFQLTHNIEGKEDKISAELRQNIFLIFKEAITNAAKYGSGELVTASLKKENDKLIVLISNQTENPMNIKEVSGLGLSNIKKRTEDMNGIFKIENKDASFMINLSFPL
jgi:signal transduction histidine kinase